MVKQNFEDNPKPSHKELSLSVVHILATCSSNLRKGLQQGKHPTPILAV